MARIAQLDLLRPVPPSLVYPGGHVRLSWILAATILLAPSIAGAQQVTLLGTWKFDLKQGPKKEGPRMVVVRADSSASYGTETVRWRIIGDSLALALGGEWVSYRLRLNGRRLTLSGGDLTEPVTFERVGPPTARPDSVPVPPDPDEVSS
ncbi:MAG: hypothetical protein ACREMX_13040 [Gemmatimonadales bacterium]